MQALSKRAFRCAHLMPACQDSGKRSMRPSRRKLTRPPSGATAASSSVANPACQSRFAMWAAGKTWQLSRSQCDLRRPSSRADSTLRVLLTVTGKRKPHSCMPLASVGWHTALIALQVCRTSARPQCRSMRPGVVCTQGTCGVTRGVVRTFPCIVLKCAFPCSICKQAA